jgi:chromodomain-helicase-DNA-binding protein 4
MRGGICMGCMKVALTPDTKLRGTPVAPLIHESGDVEMVDDSSKAASTSEPPCEETSEEVLFRCVTCKRLAHYEHLPVPSDLQHQMEPGDAVALAEYYQQTTDWQCADCSSYTYKVDKILAWRPYPSDAVEPVRKHGEVPNIKSQLPREYLVKWVDRSYRRAQWVPHMWLASMASAMLKFFLTNGPKVELVAGPLPSANATEDANAETAPLLEIDAEESRDSSAQPDAKPLGLPSDPTLDAELRIPPLWRTVDCVLDVLLWAPHKRHQKTKPIKKKARAHVDSGDEVDEDPHIQAEYAAAFDDGEQPSENYTDSVEDFQKRMGRDIAVEDIDRVIWAFIKWADMGYDECQ